MSFRLANVTGRTSLVAGEDYYDAHAVSGGYVSDNPMLAIADPAALHDLDATLEACAPSGSLATARLDAPIPHPRQVFAIGLNYADHLEETGLEPPASPVVFTKFPSCISAPEAPIELPNGSIDYEAEVVVVIGRTARLVDTSNAWNHVAGITGGQDVSDRALQFAASPPHFDLGKSRYGFGPIGPTVVSLDHVANSDDISIECAVNGELRQRSSTAQLIFSVPTLIEYLASILTLYPGDLIFTGTPAGVGIASGRLLEPGDVVTTRIGGVGTLTNTCVPATVRT